MTRTCWMCKSYKPEPTVGVGDGPNQPGDGDLTLCISCGEWNVFEGDGLRQPTDEEYDEVRANPFCETIRQHWLATLQHNNIRH